MNDSINKIIDYYNNSKYDDIIKLCIINKNIIIDDIHKYVTNAKNNKSKNVEMVVPYSESAYAARSIDKVVTVPLFRLIIFGIIDKYHKLKLKEETELKDPTTKITYVVTIADNEIKISLFILYLLVYYAECEIRSMLFDDLFNKKPHVGIDYEFNNRIIALMQLNFEGVPDKNINTWSYIWIVNPGEFNDEYNQILIDYLMTNTRIYKIVQGAESLDIPYMYNVMFKGNKDTILKFTSKVLDTRFLCEYFKLSIGADKRCNIYDGLKYFDVISNDKHKDLEDIHFKMGPVQNVSWNIHFMGNFSIKYALYDVLFLQHYLKNIFTRINKETPQYANTLKYIIAMVRFFYVDKNEVTNVITTVEGVINPINNYLIKHRGKNITLINVFKSVIENFKIEKEDIDVDYMLTVGYFKKALSKIFKFIVYYILSMNYDVYKDKRNLMEEQISIDGIYDTLQKNGFKKMLHFLKLFEEEAVKKIYTLYKN
uniref:Uncharacterized protein n=1 Tax=Mimivirus LCMiAC01 TaxID=2506608 RepID=A0A481Z0D9_9VIRU|nr:MAG: uncharacterized protein LCMiAC01_02220 [Mimivirus LCMiAC01]